MTLRPSRREDFIALLGEPPAYRCKCQTIECDGRVIGVGGLVYRPDGVFASVLLTDEIRRHPMALHRAVKRGLEAAGRSGVREIFAGAQQGNAMAEPWLRRLGFKPLDVRGEVAWVWRHKDNE